MSGVQLRRWSICTLFCMASFSSIFFCIMSSRFSLPSAVANRSKNDVVEALDRLEAYEPRDPTDLMLSAVPGRASLPADVDGRPREAKERRLIDVDGRGASYLRR